MLCERSYHVTIEDKRVPIPLEFHGELRYWWISKDMFFYAIPDTESRCLDTHGAKEFQAWMDGDVWRMVIVYRKESRYKLSSPIFGRKNLEKLIATVIEEGWK